ncbi:MAG: hypothetical protein PHE79_11740 [Eubacteriales bacterium]|nr:hypothetical protein [Eubacteriales bacterium]
MTDRELLELIAAEVGSLKKDMKEAKDRLQSVENTVIKIENDHGEKLKALFDGYVQNSEKLERIEKEVTRQEEVILRKVK